MREGWEGRNTDRITGDLHKRTRRARDGEEQREKPHRGREEGSVFPLESADLGVK